MTARTFRLGLAVAVSAALVLSVVAAAVLWLERGSVEISVTDVGVMRDAPESGMTEVHARLVLRNVGHAVAHFALVTLFANDPVNGTLFGTFSHSDLQLGPGETLAFSETTSVSGTRSTVGFTVKVFPSDGPSWQRTLVPDEPVTWTAW